MGKFNTAKQFIGQIFGGKQKTTGKTINPFKANPQTKDSKHKITLAKIPGKVQRRIMPIQRDMQKTSVAFKQINQKLKGEPVTKSGVSKGKDLRENRMGGGMMGRRMGYSEGKLAVTPREKQLAAQYGDKKRITRGDVITAAKKKSGKRMQARNGTRFGATRPKPDSILDPSNPINKRKKELTDKQKTKEDMK